MHVPDAAGESVPAAQFVHDPLLALLYLPAVQSRHTVAFSALYLPALHVGQAVRAAFIYEPAAQSVHDCAPVPLAIVPFAHGLQADAEPLPAVAENVPAAQGVHTVPPCAYVPAGQIVQLVRPVLG